MHHPHRTAISARITVVLVLSGLVPALAPCAGAAPRKGPATFDPALRIERSGSLDVPPPGSWDMRLVSPTVIEIDWFNSAPKGGSPATWDFARGDKASLPPPTAFEVRAGGAIVAVEAVGFRRRPTFAAKSRRDLRIGNALYLRLASPVPGDGEVRIRNPSADIWTGTDVLVARMDPLRRSAAIHVAHVGYSVGSAKRAAVGTWMGSLG